MNFSEYQTAAKETDLAKEDSPEGLLIAVLGLVSEAGSIANVVKKYLRDALSISSQRDFLRTELGDVLWYLSTVASRVGLKLEDIAQANISRTRDRHGTDDRWTAAGVTNRLDEGYPATERCPDRVVFGFSERAESDRTLVSVTVLRAEPNAFPDGALTETSTGKPIGFSIGDPLTDNSKREDKYRYHDVFHIGFMTVLGWSPVLRRLLRLKRKSQPEIDHNEDGARACDIEEGISAYLAQRASMYNDFEDPKFVDNTTIDYVLEQVKDLEVAQRPGWLWKIAISRGFVAWKQVSQNRGGYLTADLKNRTLTYSRLAPSAGPTDTTTTAPAE